MKVRIFLVWCGLAVLVSPGLVAQSQPLVCQVVTADQIGGDGQNTAAIQAQLDFCGAGSGKQTAVILPEPCCAKALSRK